MKASASQIKTFSACALQAKYQYVDRLDRWTVGSSAHFGTSVHAGLELLHSGGTLDEAIERFREVWGSVEIEYWNHGTSETRFRDLGPKMIREYNKTYKWTYHRTLGTEYRFMVPFGDHILSGIIDHFYTNKEEDHLYIVDFKTGKKPTLKNLYLDVQMTTYDWSSRQKEFWVGMESDDPKWPDKYAGMEDGEVLYEKFKDVPRTLIWYDLKNNEPVFAGPRESFDYARLYRVVEQIDRAIEHEVFIPTISAETCEWCDFKDICPVYFDEP